VTQAFTRVTHEKCRWLRRWPSKVEHQISRKSLALKSQGPIPGLRSRDSLLPASRPSAYMPHLQARLITLPRECFLIRVLRLVTWYRTFRRLLPANRLCRRYWQIWTGFWISRRVLEYQHRSVCCSTFNLKGCEKESNQLERMVRRRRQRR